MTYNLLGCLPRNHLQERSNGQNRSSLHFKYVIEVYIFVRNILFRSTYIK